MIQQETSKKWAKFPGIWHYVSQSKQWEREQKDNVTIKTGVLFVQGKKKLVMLPLWLKAGVWGLVAGSALIIGASVGYFTQISRKWVAFVMAFGSGVLISALSFNLMDEAFRRGGFMATAIGFLAGAVVYTVANLFVNKAGGKHRKRSGEKQKSENEKKGSGLAIALGSLMDGIPEAIVIGVSMIESGAVSMVAVIAVFLSNIPEGLSSASGMKKAGRSAKYIFGVWIGIAVICGVSALCGYVIFDHFSPGVIAATTAVAAGAILSMLSDTMIPEAFEVTHDYAGLITVFGFLCAFVLAKIAM